MLPTNSSKNYSVSQGVGLAIRPACIVLYTNHMRIVRLKPIHQFIRRHWIVLSSIIVLTISSLLTINWFTNTIEQSIATTQAESLALIAEIDEQIKEIEARKAEEARLKKLADAKAASEAVIANPSTAIDTVDPASCNVSGQRTDATSIGVLVNKKHCIQPLNYAPADLVTLYGATISAKAADDFTALFQAAQAAGQGLSVTSSYRSYSTQVSTYSYWVGVSGADGADEYSARPGYSEHQTGFAIDFANATGSCSLDCFGTTTQYAWLQDNAATYGFIQRYYGGKEAVTGYMAEEWHYRYVGPAVALDMKAKGILTLEEYWGLPGGDY